MVRLNFTAKKIMFFILIAAIYVFVLGIQTMGTGFKLMGKGFSHALLEAVADPFSSFCIGLLVTSILQSSSCTTSILVTLCAAGVLPVSSAIPAIMGANIGTAITNTLVAFGHITRKEEFKRAFGGSLVHDYFNILAVIILLPIEILFHPLEFVATSMASSFAGIGGLMIASPIKFVTAPFIDFFKYLFLTTGYAGICMIVLGGAFLFLALKYIIKCMRFFVTQWAESKVTEKLFEHSSKSFSFSLTLTSVIQSSSITTSLLVPLLGVGVVDIKRILPYTIGANIGTTITAIFAALAAGIPAGLALAFVHLLFNIIGGCTIYFLQPLQKVPIKAAEKSGEWCAYSKKGFFVMVGGYVIGTSYILPIVYLFLSGIL
jgi:sodium-dependent phosphate cotransporter